jgi:hypothetical protein
MIPAHEPHNLWRRTLLSVSLLLTALLSLPPAHAQSQFVNEANLLDAVLERREFWPIERLALDLNGDGIVDVADLVYHLVFYSHLAPSVAFDSFTSRTFEADTALTIPLAFSKAFAAPVTLSYTVSGTATIGADCTIAGYDTGADRGTITADPGATSAAITIQILDDAVFGEGIETLQFTLTGGDPESYYLGALQTHLVYLDDNDSVWKAGLHLPEAGYIEFSMEITQDQGAFSGRVLSDGGLISAPEESDPNRSGTDGWMAVMAASGNGIRIEVGPLPVDPSQSFFEIHYNRYFVLDVAPGVTNYAYDPNRVFAGEASQVLVPVRSRLGPAWTARSFLRRESAGTFAMMRHANDVVLEEAHLADAP